MNVHTTPAGSSFEPDGEPHALLSTPRPLYWSVRRELWESRSIYLAPLIVAVFVLFGSFLATLSAGAMRANAGSSVTAKQEPIVAPIKMAPAPIMLTTFLVGFLYCFDALYGERRDRSILFWKSLPVSDVTTVLSKASIPLVVLPLIGLLLGIAAQLLLLPAAIAVSLGSGVSPLRLWDLLPEPLIMVYGLTVHALWFAPIYGWLLLVSAWARRAPLLWALLPMVAVSAIERITFNTTAFLSMLQYRMTGAMKEAFTATGDKSGNFQLNHVDPLNFLSTPGLWAGLIFTTACLAAAVRLRRNREPI